MGFSRPGGSQFQDFHSHKNRKRHSKIFSDDEADEDEYYDLYKRKDGRTMPQGNWRKAQSAQQRQQQFWQQAQAKQAEQQEKAKEAFQKKTYDEFDDFFDFKR